MDGGWKEVKGEMPMFPVAMKTPGSEMPKEDTHYIVARNGIFLRKKNWWVDAVVRIPQISVLDPQETSAEILLPKIPADSMWKAIAFFQEVYRLYGSEAAILLHFSENKGWTFSVPHQRASAWHVSYNAYERLEGYQCVGTMHSHGSLAAYHSSTDQHDEAEFDGIHITVGRLSSISSLFSLDTEVVVNGNRFRKNPMDIIDGLKEEFGSYKMIHPWSEKFLVPAEWIDNVYSMRNKPPVDNTPNSFNFWGK